MKEHEKEHYEFFDNEIQKRNIKIELQRSKERGKEKSGKKSGKKEKSL